MVVSGELQVKTTEHAVIYGPECVLFPPELRRSLPALL